MKRDGLGKETPVVVVGGPTASGKSALALAIAEAFNGTVINADAMQVYRELSVLTARPNDADTARAPHLLYGVLSADQRCTAARWREMAIAAIAETEREGRLPVVVGGTGLYIRALMEGLAPIPDIPEEIRAQARARHETLGAAAFHAELVALDPSSARLNPGDTTRVLRAWEVVTATGRSLDSFQKLPVDEAPHRFITVVMSPPREVLYASCDTRCEAMLASGALEEVRALLALGLDANLPAMKALGVRELAALLDGTLSREEAVARFQKATRNYAKRQVTWFRHQVNDPYICSEQYSESLRSETFSFIRKKVDGFESPG